MVKCKCGKIARYGIFVEGKQKKQIPKYCNLHKKLNMIDVVTLRCIKDDCMIFPSFNLPGNHKKLYCKNHALDGMVNTYRPKRRKKRKFNPPIIEETKDDELNAAIILSTLRSF